MTSLLRLLALVVAVALPLVAVVGQVSQPSLNEVHARYAAPLTDQIEDMDAAPADDDLASVLAQAYGSNPGLAAQRYDLRATDDGLGIALSRTRATVQFQATTGYDYTDPGAITQAARPLADRLNNPDIERNDVATQLLVDQPLWTGGRAFAETRSARADIAAAREALRGAEGNLLVDLIAAYADVRRDGKVLSIRERNVTVLGQTLAEVVARRRAGELTRTDIAQAETQLMAAQVQLTAAQAQLEASRSTFARLVGRTPGRLAPEPPLPLIPASVDEALDVAAQANPELAAAILNERASRARIAQARAEANPTISLRGTAGTTGPVSPFDRRDQDITLGARATLTVPLINGGRIQAQIAQAKNRNSADLLRVEASRRDIVDSVLTTWNAWASAKRNVEMQSVQVQAARIYYDGTFKEYREGLRSTFDVLFAQNQLRETEIALISNRRDAYVAQAVLLRRIGKLDAASLLDGPTLYDPAAYTRRVERRGALPWDFGFRVLDIIDHPSDRPQRMEQLKPSNNTPVIASPTIEQVPTIVPARAATPLPNHSPRQKAGNHE
ncbi:MAG: TolC family outer membrane protein [Sphingorhabdus sp.]|uniref:TolC family outer membrane protein n=1 Tax=Sphingorhabdus sp. TaxID=1902408 RepID=UPI0025EF1254|nr:TolC family outer membrane protein [Sphingorhabdus sp.]MCO4092932.1 TolC family outer membrane protein [Sphingorhabdus sp.]